jgi:uncharacterized membrane protein YadS
VAGFAAAVAIRTFVPVPEALLASAATVQSVLLGLALVGLGSGIRLESLVRTGGRAVLVGLGSWVVIATVSFGAVVVLPLG